MKMQTVTGVEKVDMRCQKSRNRPKTVKWPQCECWMDLQALPDLYTFVSADCILYGTSFPVE
jgi:hypothetical protein